MDQAPCHVLSIDYFTTTLWERHCCYSPPTEAKPKVLGVNLRSHSYLANDRARMWRGEPGFYMSPAIVDANSGVHKVKPSMSPRVLTKWSFAFCKPNIKSYMTSTKWLPLGNLQNLSTGNKIPEGETLKPLIAPRWYGGLAGLACLKTKAFIYFFWRYNWKYGIKETWLKFSCL